MRIPEMPQLEAVKDVASRRSSARFQLARNHHMTINSSAHAKLKSGEAGRH